MEKKHFLSDNVLLLATLDIRYRDKKGVVQKLRHKVRIPVETLKLEKDNSGMDRYKVSKRVMRHDKVVEALYGELKISLGDFIDKASKLSTEL